MKSIYNLLLLSLLTMAFSLTADKLEAQSDAAVLGDYLHPEYTALPAGDVGTPLLVGATAFNIGTGDITNVMIDVEVMDASMTVVHTETLGPIATIASGADEAITGTGFTPTTADTYTAVYTLSMDEVDDDPTNNVSNRSLAYADKIGRDGENFSGTLGIGDGTVGTLGHELTVDSDFNIVAAEFMLGASTNPGEIANVSIYSMTASDGPDELLATSNDYIVDNANDSTWITVTFPCAVFIAAGTPFYIGINESSTGNVALSYTFDIFTAGKTWVTFPANMGWSVSEDFNFFPAYRLRPIEGPVTAMLAATVDASSDIDSTGMGSATVAATGGVPPYTYEWTDGQTTETATGLMPGDYGCIITDANGCSVEVFTTVDNTVGLNDIESLVAFDINPNPASNQVKINLELNQIGNASLQIFDVTGKILYSSKSADLLNKEFVIDLNNYETGVYVARLIVDSQTASKRIVVQK